MIKFINKFMSILGYAIYSKTILKTYSYDYLKKEYKIDDYDLAYINGKLSGGFKDKLIKENKSRWLDVGCGGNFEDNFMYIDTFTHDKVGFNKNYVQADIINLTDADVEKLGKFDFIRMQHVFEHFTPEDGLKVLSNCAKILNKDGYILMTTPDLNKFIALYSNNKIKEYYDWALTRIDKESPSSFYFSIFTHSVLNEQHKWCYDAEGLMYQLTRSGYFYNITEIAIGDKLANIPFTHNRPIEEVCVFAQLK